jgi:hypothetical protein
VTGAEIVQDLTRLRWNMLLLVVCAVFGASTVIVALHFTRAARLTENRAQAEQTEIRTKLARARDEETDLRNKIEGYRRLTERGYIGQEHRLDWIEQIRKINQNRKLIDLQYEMLPQQEIDPATIPGSDPTYAFMSSTMHLQMQLLHEGDLLNFLDDLRASVTAFIRVKNCSVDRVGEGSETAGAAQLRADCTLEWITLREKK